MSAKIFPREMIRHEFSGMGRPLWWDKIPSNKLLLVWARRCTKSESREHLVAFHRALQRIIRQIWH